MKKLLAAIIILVALVSLSLGLTMVFTESHGSPFPGLLALLGELLLAAANILVLLLNLLYWKLYGAPRWLRIVIWIQVVPALATLALVSVQIYQNCSKAGHTISASRSEEHTSELQSLMRISYAVFCLKKKTQDTNQHT